MFRYSAKPGKSASLAPCRHNEVTRRLHRATRVPLCCHWSAEVRGEARGRRDARWGWKQVGCRCGTYCHNTVLQQRPTMLFFMEKKVMNSIFVLENLCSNVKTCLCWLKYYLTIHLINTNLSMKVINPNQCTIWLYYQLTDTVE